MTEYLGHKTPNIGNNTTEAAIDGEQETKDGKAPKASREHHLGPSGRLLIQHRPWAQAVTGHGARHSHRGVLAVEAVGHRVEEVFIEKAEVVDLVALEVLEVGRQRRRDIAIGGTARDGAGVLELDAVGRLLQIRIRQLEEFEI